jgi:gas vesicle protein
MTQPEQSGSSGLTVFLSFLGGALVGGVAAMLLTPRSGADTRKRLVGAANDTRELAARVPQAVREASAAAQEAFAGAMK